MFEVIAALKRRRKGWFVATSLIGVLPLATAGLAFAGTAPLAFPDAASGRTFKNVGGEQGFGANVTPAVTPFAGRTGFESLREGIYPQDGLTDPETGIHFHNSTAFGFSIEYVGPGVPNLPRTSGGNMLSSFGYVPGVGYSVPNSFGFIADLPSPTNFVAFDVIYVTNDYLKPTTINLRLLGSDGLAVGQKTFTLPSGNFLENNVSISRPAADIYGFQVIPGNISPAFDNVAVPEPVGTLLGVMIACAVRRASRRT